MAYINFAENAVRQFADMLISRMEQMKAFDWKKGWMGGNGLISLPQNMSGRNYSGLNSLFLQMNTADNHYSMPVFLTFFQIQAEDLRIKAGSKPFPVLLWNTYIKDKDGNKISEEDYRNMSKKEQDECTVKSYLRAFTVYNVDQTNMKEVKPEKYQALQERFKPLASKDVVTGMYENKALDRMFATQGWVCPIQFSSTVDTPKYSITRDMVIVPEKSRFRISKTPDEIYKDGMEYYSSVLHEMAHSTGSEERLNRREGSKYGEPQYAKEELVAELTAAAVGNTLGFDRRILDNNAAYLDYWIDVLQKEPQFLVSVMSDVKKASEMIYEHIDKQKLALGERPLLYTNQSSDNSRNNGISEGDSQKMPMPTFGRGVTASVFKQPDGEYAVNVTLRGNSLETKVIDREAGARYMAMKPGKAKYAALVEIVKSAHGETLPLKTKPKVNKTKGLKL